MSITCTHVSELESIECPTCAGTYAISKAYKNEAYKIGGFRMCWTCPYCKTDRGFGESEVERVRKQLAQAQTDIERKEAQVRDYQHRNAHLAASQSAYRGHFNRIARRIKNGICPCCNRTFKQLAAHMHAKHPNYVPSISEDSP